MVDVFIADLRHNYNGVMSVDMMPLGIGFMKAVMDRDLPDARSTLFAYPDRLWTEIERTPPDVLMLSNYCWNEALSLHFAKVMKRVRPETLVVMGGPNLYLEDSRKIEFFREHEDMDVYVLGEGDFLATEVVRKFIESDCVIERFRELDLPSSMYRRPDGEVVLADTWDRHKQVDEVPSPWTSGIMDGFFDGKLAPMIETNRGCPFSCTFCVQGTRWYTKVHYFSEDRLAQDIDYIGHRVKTLSPSMGTLMIADPNYGMYERDAEISGFIAESQKKYGWPTFIVASTGKNRPDRIINALDPLNNALTFRQALQSTNKDTLVQIKRANIKQEAYASVMREVEGRGMRSISDLILGLPNETLESHLDAIRQLVDTGTKEMYNFQLMMLKGTELETEESRKNFDCETRFRVISKGFGEYAGGTVFDTEEIAVITNTLSFEDYVTARKYAFAFSILWNNSWFEDPVALAKKCGVRPSQVLDAMVSRLDDGTGPASKMLADFVAETVGELFPTREACIEFYSQEENFRKLAHGDIGDNLVYKYRAAASFFSWREICELAFATIRPLVRKSGVAFDSDFWEDFEQFVALAHAHGKSKQEILAPARAEFQYDIKAWLDAGAPIDPEPFRFDVPHWFEFSLTESATGELRKALDVWGTELAALTKGVMRIRPASQIRTCRPVEQPQALSV